MKDFMRTLAQVLVVMCGLLLFAIPHYKIPVKYFQHFAERQIVVTEHLTLAERLLLPQKKGLIEIYE